MKFERLEYLFGKEGLNKLKNATVAVIGIGGVGGTAANCLVRSGIGNLIICDYDYIEETNINRQIIANNNNIGSMKTDVLEQMLLDINPECKIRKISSPYNENIFTNDNIYVIDAIDDIKSKILLIKNCLQKNITFISAMGAGKKTEVDKIKI